jgi:hypothetical protein
MMVALPPEYWYPLALLPLPEFVEMLRLWADQVHFKRFLKALQRKKNKKPKPPFDPNRPHVSTARLLQSSLS